MAGATIHPVEKGIEERLQAMMNRSNTMAAFLDRVIVKKYQKAQTERWESENVSEGGRWKALTEKYAKRKRKMPDVFQRLMTLHGKLVDAATLRGDGFNKIVTNRGIEIALDLGALPYARRVSSDRPTMIFSDRTIEEWKNSVKGFIGRGVDNG